VKFHSHADLHGALSPGEPCIANQKSAFMSHHGTAHETSGWLCEAILVHGAQVGEGTLPHIAEESPFSVSLRGKYLPGADYIAMEFRSYEPGVLLIAMEFRSHEPGALLIAMEFRSHEPGALLIAMEFRSHEPVTLLIAMEFRSHEPGTLLIAMEFHS
jgi:hypothetical protein